MKISIVTTCYNSEDTIETTIKSVLNQKTSDVEYIVIDGGSQDRTSDIINKYEKDIDFYISERDRGVADGFNKGIKYATGDLILILNSDDELYPGALDKVFEISDSKTDIYYGDCIVVDEKNHTESYQKAMPLSYMDHTLPCSHQSIYISREMYKKYGGYSLKYKLCTDYDLISKMYKGGAKFKYINYPLCKYRQGGCTYVSPWKTSSEVIRIAKKRGLSKGKACYYFIYFVMLGYGKRACEFLGILEFVRKIRERLNKRVSYKEFQIK